MFGVRAEAVDTDSVFARLLDMGFEAQAIHAVGLADGFDVAMERLLRGPAQEPSQPSSASSRAAFIGFGPQAQASPSAGAAAGTDGAAAAAGADGAVGSESDGLAAAAAGAEGAAGADSGAAGAVSASGGAASASGDAAGSSKKPKPGAAAAAGEAVGTDGAAAAAGADGAVGSESDGLAAGAAGAVGAASADSGAASASGGATGRSKKPKPGAAAAAGNAAQPKKPKSAKWIWDNENRARVTRESGLEPKQMSLVNKKMEEVWKALPQESKAPYEAKYAEAMEAYNAAMRRMKAEPVEEELPQQPAARKKPKTGRASVASASGGQAPVTSLAGLMTDVPPAELEVTYLKDALGTAARRHWAEGRQVLLQAGVSFILFFIQLACLFPRFVCWLAGWLRFCWLDCPATSSCCD